MNNDTIEVTLYDIDHIPSYRIAEAERQANEQERIASEQERNVYFEDLKEKIESGSYNPEGGVVPTIGENGNWYLGNEDTGKPSRGEQGEQGERGEKGDKGDKGDTGLAGADGKDGTDGKDGKNATINGFEAISILAGENITLTQENDNLTINADVKGYTGDRELLETENKTDFVSAINEIVNNMSDSGSSISFPKVSKSQIFSLTEPTPFIYEDDSSNEYGIGYFYHKNHPSFRIYVNTSDAMAYFYWQNNSNGAWSKKIKLGSTSITNNTFDNNVVVGTDIKGYVGERTKLATEDKTSIVNAINELVGNIADLEPSGGSGGDCNLKTINSSQELLAIDEIGIYKYSYKDGSVQRSGVGICNIYGTTKRLLLIDFYGTNSFIRVYNSNVGTNFTSSTLYELQITAPTVANGDKSIMTGGELYKYLGSNKRASTLITTSKNVIDGINETYVKATGVNLWTSDDTSIEFANQTITLDENLSSYSYIEVIYKRDKDTDYYLSTGKIPVIAVSMGLIQIYYDNKMFARKFTYDKTTANIIFESCTAGTDTNNGVGVPYRILGY